MNTLCDTALLCGFADNIARIGKEEVKSAIDELQWTDYNSRTDRLAVLRGVGAQTGEDVVGKIIVAHKDEEPREIPLTQGRIIMGRTSDNDLQIDSKFVSRHHAQVVTYGRNSVVEDLNSTNGVYFRGKRVKKQRLNQGDVFIIGEHELMYVREGQKSSSKSDTAKSKKPGADEPAKT